MVTATVHIVDDDTSFRTAVARLLKASGFDVESYSGSQELLDRVPDGPGCILLDQNMPGLSGLELQDRLLQLAPLMPIIFLSGAGSVSTSVRAMKAGADDFLEKPASSADLLAAVRRAVARGEAQRLEQDKLNLLQAVFKSLTPREVQVFKQMVRGRLNKQIAFDLATSERTIKAHRHKVMEKLHARSLAEAISIADKLGLLGPPD
ncbi:response regulator transcription factor [Rhizobium sp. TH2]|uniref:response regulator transcription factor n=1 Tax=Rhizobium sp. TH2 TaxID=2775403 RepID=UPI002157AEA3|nr:response regulator [Rhizobium sp. TH2]UVC09596.1 response regulator transcription factor [Rhizobium sp. TH2]